MTQQMENSAAQHDPDGSIFLPERLPTDRFLALEGNPDEVVAEIVAQDKEAAAYVLECLRFSLLQSRGVEKISADANDIEIQREIEKRYRFYKATELCLS